MGGVLKNICPFLIAILLVGTVHIASGEPFDMYYIQVIVTVITSLFSVYFVYCMLSQACLPSNLYKYLISCTIGAILLNNLCAFTAVVQPSIYGFLQSIQEVAADQDRLMNASGEMHRIMGLGENVFFNGGVISSLGLILCMYKMLHTESRVSTGLFFIAYISIVFSGILIARTTIIGVVLSMFLLFLHANSQNIVKYLFVVLFSALIIASLFFAILNLLNPDMAGWAFEFVFNMMDTGSASMESTDILWSMWDVLPTNFMTYLIGDGLLKAPNGSYYKGIDVGYLRLTYYSGLLVMFSLFVMLKRLLKVRFSIRLTSVEKLNLVLFSWLLIMNIKGICLPVAIVVLFCYLQKKVSYHEYLSSSEGLRQDIDVEKSVFE